MCCVRVSVFACGAALSVCVCVICVRVICVRVSAFACGKVLYTCLCISNVHGSHMRKWAQNVRRCRIEHAAEIPAQVHSLADESEPAKKSEHSLLW